MSCRPPSSSGCAGPILVLFCAWLAGCAVGPNYERPTVNSPQVFRDQDAATGSSIADMAWWQVYKDAALQGLIREALANNYDIRLAAARVEEARAIVTQTRSQFVPNVNYDGVIGRGRNDLFNAPQPDNSVSTASVLTTLNASWELDLWGRVRRLNESARAQFLATEEARRGVQLSLISDVATDYFRLMELDRELEITNRTADSFAESLKIFARSAEGGTASDLEAARAEAALADAAAAIPSDQEEISITENALSVLLGRNPGRIERSHSPFAEMLPPDVPSGLPSALLERRPDIREAEQLLRSANAQVGESEAEFFPKFGLTTFLGKISQPLSAYSLGSSNAWGVGAEATGPLFDAGRLVGQYHGAKAARDAARLGYQQTVLTAFREVSDALVSRQRLAEIRAQQAREVAALERAVRLSTERYVAGRATYYEILEAQQELFPAELNLARTQRDQLLQVVSLYGALGGGWQPASPE